MERKKFVWIDNISLIVATVTFVCSFLFFFHYSDMLSTSLAAAILASGCTWLAYFILRWLLLATK